MNAPPFLVTSPVLVLVADTLVHMVDRCPVVVWTAALIKEQG